MGVATTYVDDILISDSQITDVLSDYGVRPSTAQCARVRAYVSLLLRWNRAISLTSVKDELEILKFHFGESVFALSVIEGIDGRLADVGAGAGFPGLPIRIFREALQLILIEPNAKKAAFLSEVIRELSLDGVQV
ncbi:MAG: 16S rRNA (guanine(527)-N(7))-methyltransferase RsmG, partial [Acidobacteriota bacterium]|nr:16S rRNA (guanine(527)-N(7))-methyltransferase RsmG [Acidobacteriota bacterium]